MVGDFVGHANRAEEDGIVAADLVFPVVGQHLAVLFKIVPAGKIEMVKLQVDAKFARRRVQHQQTLGHDFGANAVSGDNGDAVCAGHGCSLCVWCVAAQLPRIGWRIFPENPSAKRRTVTLVSTAF